jgi:hypothetical protein
VTRLPRPAALAAAGFALAAAVALPAHADHDPENYDPLRPPAGWAACERGHVPPAPFQDVAGNAHERQITCLPWYGVANGTTPTRYGPELLVRRDQFAGLLARALDEARVALPPAQGRFSDLDGNVHRDAIERLAQAGLVTGTSATTFGPAGAVSRAQAAALFARTFFLVTGAERSEPRYDYFSDDDDSVHEYNINVAAEAGMVVGKVRPTHPQDNESSFIPGLYDPDATVQRDQAASFLARLLDFFIYHVQGSVENPYRDGETALLKDGWELAVVGADNDANAEVAVYDPDNPGPEEDRQYVIYRVRATYTGAGESAFDGADRLSLERGVIDPRKGCGGRPAPTVGFGSGNGAGETIEGNLCFEVPSNGIPGTGYLAKLVDTRWGNPLEPHLTGSGSPYPPLSDVQ